MRFLCTGINLGVLTLEKNIMLCDDVHDSMLYFSGALAGFLVHIIFCLNNELGKTGADHWTGDE